jgi:hypothetical protein
MHLSEEAQVALNRLHTEPHDSDLATLGQELERLFPIYRLPCGLCVKWSDEVTPERLVASGWTQVSRIKTGKYNCETVLTLETPEGQWQFYHTISQRKWIPFTHINLMLDELDRSLPQWMTPKTMGGVWRLMEAAGIRKRVVREC